jgi:hypothetical protein
MDFSILVTILSPVSVANISSCKALVPSNLLEALYRGYLLILHILEKKKFVLGNPTSSPTILCQTCALVHAQVQRELFCWFQIPA